MSELIKIVPSISAKQMLEALKLKDFKENIPCESNIRRMIKKMKDEVAGDQKKAEVCVKEEEEKVNDKKEAKKVNDKEKEEINKEIVEHCFDFTALNIIDNGRIVLNLHSTRDKKMIFLKDDKHFKNNELKSVRGKIYVGDYSTKNGFTYSCKKCRNIYDIQSSAFKKNQNNNEPSEKCPKIIGRVVLDDKNILNESLSSFHSNKCESTALLSVIIQQIERKFYGMMEEHTLKRYDANVQFYEFAAKIALSNNLSIFEITSSVDFPDYSTFSKNADYHKRKINYKCVSNDPSFLNTIDNRPFIRVIQNDMILCVSNIGLEMMAYANIVSSDGTFEKSSSDHQQIYNFQAMVAGRFYLSVFVLMKNKNKNSYRIVFQLIKDMVEHEYEEKKDGFIPFSKKILFIDKEMAVINVASTIWGSKVRLCCFHTISAFQKKLRNLNLKKYYSSIQRYNFRNISSTDHLEFYDIIQAIYTLPYFPYEHMIKFWKDELKLSLNKLKIHPTRIKQFVDYIDSNWMEKKGCYHPEQMSIYGLDIRTNNACENFHSVMKKCSLFLKKGRVNKVCGALKLIEIKYSSEYLKT
uniref:MULE domain-containing protein n=1 Tax=Strongyloides papillosus TaxID=174720 RepID=A0A0N5CBP1_STREA